MSLKEELSCNGVPPTGPVSGWPKERHDQLMGANRGKQKQKATKVTATAGGMAKGLFRTATSAVRHGKVSSEIREERYDTCKACPFFVEDSKRCSDCGCFMEAKTWVGGDPDALCPQKKWSR
jgi:hypothetical protein